MALKVFDPKAKMPLVNNPAPSPLDAGGILSAQSNQNFTHQNKLFDQNNKGLDWITGPTGDPTQSPLYSSFLTKARENVSNTYDKAVMNSRANAGSRGFGYASPMEQTGELGVRSQEAGALSGAPATALQETMPYNMEAMNMRSGEAKVFGDEAMGQEDMWNSDIMEHWKQKQENKRKLYSSIAKVASSAIAPGGMLMGKDGV
jgi:hypothetical protein